MPRSNGEGVTALRSYFEQLEPLSVVDIGPGAGTYFDAYNSVRAEVWTAIEIWEPYISAYHLEAKYDRVILGDVRTVDLPDADLYIAGDVLEHMPRADAVAVVQRIKHTAEYLMVSVPIVHYEQGSIEGNIHETHHYHWSTDEMSELLGVPPVTPPVWECGAWFVATKDIPCAEADAS